MQHPGEEAVGAAGQAEGGVEAQPEPTYLRHVEQEVVGGGDVDRRACRQPATIEEAACRHPGLQGRVELRDHGPRHGGRPGLFLGGEQRCEPPVLGVFVVVDEDEQVVVSHRVERGVARRCDAGLGLVDVADALVREAGDGGSRRLVRIVVHDEQADGTVDRRRLCQHHRNHPGEILHASIGDDGDDDVRRRGVPLNRVPGSRAEWCGRKRQFSHRPDNPLTCSADGRGHAAAGRSPHRRVGTALGSAGDRPSRHPPCRSAAARHVPAQWSPRRGRLRARRLPRRSRGGGVAGAAARAGARGRSLALQLALLDGRQPPARRHRAASGVRHGLRAGPQ